MRHAAPSLPFRVHPSLPSAGFVTVRRRCFSPGHAERQPYQCTVSRGLYGFSSVEIPSVVQPVGTGSCRQYQRVCRCQLIIRHRERCLYKVVPVHHTRPTTPSLCPSGLPSVWQCNTFPASTGSHPTWHPDLPPCCRDGNRGGCRRHSPREIDVVPTGRTADAEGIGQIHGKVSLSFPGFQAIFSLPFLRSRFTDGANMRCGASLAGMPCKRGKSLVAQ